ncbi:MULTISPECIES: hypothetical protein [Borreliella]|nr:hypothetical protein [Borreliella garinii]WNZ74069.1 hypothetical protein PT142_04745 [Borreliella garinii]WNZ75040.1 hypothetical protein PT137_04695 [Borreliella garinii]
MNLNVFEDFNNVNII